MSSQRSRASPRSRRTRVQSENAVRVRPRAGGSVLCKVVSGRQRVLSISTARCAAAQSLQNTRNRSCGKNKHYHWP